MAAILGICGFCFYKIYTIKTSDPVQQHYLAVDKPSNHLWGLAPHDACSIFNKEGLAAVAYRQVDPNKSEYACHSVKATWPDQQKNKVFSFMGSGFADKVTHLEFKMTIKGDRGSKDAVIAKKAFAVYSAEMLNQLFAIKLSEQDLQQLTMLDNNPYRQVYKNKLLIAGQYSLKDGLHAYVFSIDGMQVL